MSEGWYIPQQSPNVLLDAPKPRWVLGVIKGRVVYSRGGDSHYDCLEQTMKRWIRETRAKRASHSIGAPHE